MKSEAYETRVGFFVPAPIESDSPANGESE